MESYKFKIICLLEGTYFLDILNKCSMKIEIRDVTLNMLRNEGNIEISSRFKARSELEIDSKFRDAIETLKCIITFYTRRTPTVHSFNIYNLDKSQGYSEVGCSMTVVDPIQFPDINNFANDISVINKSVHLENALHYYRLANLTDDNKEAILNLYKCVESIIGYPGGNDKLLKGSLDKLDLTNYLDEFKGLRDLRNKFDAGHSAGGKGSGNNSHRDIKISNEEVESGRDLIQKLIEFTIKYLTMEDYIRDIFIIGK